MVQIFKNERNTILYSLLQNGVISVKKEFDGPHPDTKVDNLKVWMLSRSLQSKGYLDVVFSWRHYYFTLNDKGIAYIKGLLGVTEESVQPETRKARPEANEDQQEQRKPREGGMRKKRAPAA